MTFGKAFIIQTRMHSSRMRTAYSSGHPGGSPPGTPWTRPPPQGPDPLDQGPPDQAPLQDQAPLPLGRGTPWDQAPPRTTPQDHHHLPQTRHPLGTRHPPGPTPWDHTPPGPGTPPPVDRNLDTRF